MSQYAPRVEIAPSEAAGSADPKTVGGRLPLAGFFLRLALLLTAFFLLAADLLSTYFGHDDFMNLYKYLQGGWSVSKGLLAFWSSDYYRPMGAVAYLSLHGIFGFHPSPFKITEIVLLGANLALAGYVARLMLDSRLLGTIVMAMIFYHAAEYELYYNFGTIYDLLCFLFFYAGIAIYIHARRQNRPISPTRLLLLAVLVICALDCKEMAVSMPLIILLYEIILRDGFKVRHNWRNLTPAVLLGAIVLLFVIGKAAGTASLYTNPLYRPHISGSRYLEAMSHYLGGFFYAETLFRRTATIVFLAAGPLIALAIGSRRMLFGWLWFIVAMLPVAFIAPRADFVLYIPQVGLAIAAVAGWQDAGRRFLAARLPWAWRLLDAAGMPLFLIVLASNFAVQANAKKTYAPIDTEPLVHYQRFARGIARLNRHPRPGARILLMNDPFDANGWDDMFLLSLLREDPQLTSLRSRVNFLAFSPSLLPLYTEAYDYNGLLVWRVPLTGLADYIQTNFGNQGFLNIVNGIYPDVTEALWTKQAFALRAGCPASQPKCTVDMSLSLWATGFPADEVHQLSIQVDEQPAVATPVTAAIDENNLKIPIDNTPEGHIIHFRLDRAIPAERHPGDPRELGALLRHGTIETP